MLDYKNDVLLRIRKILRLYMITLQIAGINELWFCHAFDFNYLVNGVSYNYFNYSNY